MGIVNIKKENTIAYTLLGDYPKMPKLDKLKIDRLAITLDIPSIEERKSLDNKLAKMRENDAYATWAKKGRYKNGHSVFVEEHGTAASPDGAAFRVHTDPWDENHNYLRVELNPRKIPSFLIKAHLDNLLKDGYSRLMKDGRVTILHEAIDIHFCKLQDFYLYYPGFPCSTVLYKSGKTISTYLGKHTSQKYFCIYNKTQEIKETNANIYHNYLTPVFKKEPDPMYPIMRVELRQDFKKDTISFEKANDLPNHFSALKILNRVDVDSMADLKKEIEKSLFNLFLDSCNLKGLQQARLQLPQYWRKKFDSIMEKTKVKWWNPVNVIGERESLIKSIAFPKQLPQKYIPFFSVLNAICN